MRLDHYSSRHNTRPDSPLQMKSKRPQRLGEASDRTPTLLPLTPHDPCRGDYAHDAYLVWENGKAPVRSSQIYSFSTDRIPPGLRRMLAQKLPAPASVKQISSPLKLVVAAVSSPQSPAAVARPSKVKVAECSSPWSMVRPWS